MSESLRLRHETIDDDPPGSHHDITLIVDVNDDGRPDIVIGGKHGDPNLFWYENPSWRRHSMAHAPNLEAGGAVADITGNGRPDIIAGQQIGGNELYWFECPADPTEPWSKRVIENRFEKYHDQVIGDVDADGKMEIVFLSQKSGILGYYDIPADPHTEPWPEDHFHLIADGMEDIEGLAVIDVDGDGLIEIIAGTHICNRPAKGDDAWTRRPYAEGFVMTRVKALDIDDDGSIEIVVCEGESDAGRLAICRPGGGEPELLAEDLFHPHSIEVADFDGDGRPDIFVGEMGLGRNEEPEMMVYLNQGWGEFERVIVERGIPTHEAKVGDLTGNGLPDIVGKPYEPERHIDVWFNEP